MNIRKVKVLVYDSKSYTKESFSKVKQNHIDFTYIETKLSEDTVNLAKGFDAICVFVNDTLNKAVLLKLNEFKIKAIFLRCSGYNNVDLKALSKTKIKVFRVPAYSPYAVSEFAFAMLQTSNRRIHKAYNRTREFNFSLEDFMGDDLHGKTVGVIGTGKIGRIFIDIANGYGMKVIAYDPYQIPDPENFTYVSLDELFKESDYITLHCPLTKKNKHMIDEEAISKMKKGVMIINTSRGGLIDSAALLNGIKTRKISAACLDVYEEEGEYFYEDKSNHILDDEVLRDLISMPNVIVTSHQAFLTKEALENIAETTIENIEGFFFEKLIKDNEVCKDCVAH